MNSLGLSRFWQRANQVSLDLFPGQIRIYQPGGQGFELCCSLGRHTRESQATPGGSKTDVSATVRINKSDWPEGRPLPAALTLIDLFSSRPGEFPTVDGWGKFQLIGIAGYGAHEPAYVFTLRGRQ